MKLITLDDVYKTKGIYDELLLLYNNLKWCNIDWDEVETIINKTECYPVESLLMSLCEEFSIKLKYRIPDKRTDIYNNLGLLIKREHDDGSWIKFTHNNYGLICHTETSKKGIIRRQAYNNNLLVMEHWSEDDGDAGFDITYYHNNLPIRCQGNNYLKTWTYDNCGLLLMEQMHYPLKYWTRYIYDSYNRLIRSYDDNDIVVKYIYDDNGRLIRMYNGGYDETKIYNNQGLLYITNNSLKSEKHCKVYLYDDANKLVDFYRLNDTDTKIDHHKITFEYR